MGACLHHGTQDVNQNDLTPGHGPLDTIVSARPFPVVAFFCRCRCQPPYRGLYEGTVDASDEALPNSVAFRSCHAVFMEPGAQRSALSDGVGRARYC